MPIRASIRLRSRNVIRFKFYSTRGIDATLKTRSTVNPFTTPSFNDNKSVDLSSRRDRCEDGSGLVCEALETYKLVRNGELKPWAHQHELVIYCNSPLSAFYRRKKVSLDVKTHKCFTQLFLY